MQKLASLSAFAIFFLLSGCAVFTDGSDRHADIDPSLSLKLPAEVAMNPDAGRGVLLTVPLRLADGTELAFMLDTGATCTVFDASLESRLGKPLGTTSIQRWGVREQKSLYAMPKLFLGDTSLLTGNRVLTMDFKGLAFQTGRPVMGVLGMDVLQHYCLQLDFVAGKIRFLDDSLADKSSWGRAFPILGLNEHDWRPAVAENLVGLHGPHSLIDSGYGGNGWLMPKYYHPWTNELSSPMKGGLPMPEGRFGGEVYPQLALDMREVESDGIGLDFLARHLVTLDFPRQTLYLKRTSTGPLLAEGSGAATLFLQGLKAKGDLPGWSKDEHGEPRGVAMAADGNSGTVSVQKNGGSSLYHYQVTRSSKASPWQLQKAWRTDGDTLEEYLVR